LMMSSGFLQENRAKCDNGDEKKSTPSVLSLLHEINSKVTSISGAIGALPPVDPKINLGEQKKKEH